MNLQEYIINTKKVKPVEVKLDQPRIVEKYGTEITVFFPENIPLDDYYEISKDVANGNVKKIIKKILLNEDGTPALKKDDEYIPLVIEAAVMEKLTDFLERLGGSM